jgi:hypothetical protein
LNLPQLTVGPNVNVSRHRRNQAEQSLAINPTNPNNIAVVSNVETPVGLFKAYSTDGGTTWTTDVIADGDNLGRACCDPSLSFDQYGNLFLNYLNLAGNDVLLALSTDGGATFQKLPTIAHVESVQSNSTLEGVKPLAPNSGVFVDQPSVTTGEGSVWITYNSQGMIWAIGAPVTGLGQVGAFHSAQPVPDSHRSNFGDIAIGPNGQVMVTYQHPPVGEGDAEIFVNLDPDGLGPLGFNHAVRVTRTNVGGFDYIPAQSGRSIDAEAGLAYDRSNGARRGRVYLVYVDETGNESNDTNIYVRHSDDNGATWTGRVRVNDDATTNSQFNPRIALDQTTGNIALSWYDARNDCGKPCRGNGSTNHTPNDDAQHWATASTDGGATFLPNVQISAGTSNAADANNSTDYGDYGGLDFYGGVFRPVWADNSNSTGDNPNGALHQFDLYTAKVTVP